MATLTLKLNEYIELNAKASLGCYLSADELRHDDVYFTPQNAVATGKIYTSQIPKGATIKSTKLTYRRTNTSTGNDHKYYINLTISNAGLGDLPEDNSKIKQWLEANQNSDGSYKDLPLRFSVGITSFPHTRKAGDDPGLIIDYVATRKVTFSDVTITIEYTPAYNPTIASPTINNFIVKDISKITEYQEIAILTEASGEVRDDTESTEKIISSNYNANENYNCIYKNKGSLTFSANASVPSEQSVTTITYDLVLTAGDANKTIIYENKGNSSSNFTIDQEIFNNLAEINGADVSIDSIKCWPCDFEYVAYDIGNNGTAIKGTFYLLEDYNQPKINKFLVERINYELNPDNNSYEPKITNDGIWLATTLNIAVSKMPLKIIKSSNNLVINNYNTWSFSIKAVDEETGQVIHTNSIEYTTEWEKSINQDITLLSGAQTNSSGSIPTYSFEYDASKTYIITLTVEDNISTIMNTIDVLPAEGYFSIEVEGVAVGTRAHTGSADSPTFDVDFPSYYNKPVELSENAPASFKGVIFLAAGITYGTENPAQVYGTNAQEGQIYFKLI